MSNFIVLPTKYLVNFRYQEVCDNIRIYNKYDEYTRNRDGGVTQIF